MSPEPEAPGGLHGAASREAEQATWSWLFEKKRAHRNSSAELFLECSCHPSREQRIATRNEEVVVHTDRVNREVLAEGPDDDVLELGGRLTPDLGVPVGSRQPRCIEFAGAGAGQFIDHNDAGGNHHARQCSRAVCTQSPHIVIGDTDDVRDEH